MPEKHKIFIFFVWATPVNVHQKRVALTRHKRKSLRLALDELFFILYPNVNVERSLKIIAAHILKKMNCF
jgi:hypothetical protein